MKSKIQVIFRPAVQSDLETLYKFEQGIILAERPFEPTLKPDKIHYYDLEGFIQSEDINLIVGLVHDEIICCGYAKKVEAKDFQEIKYYAYIGFMYVTPKYRGQGISAMILNELKSWIESESISEIRLDVYANNESAIQAYEKAGFKPHLVRMRLED